MLDKRLLLTVVSLATVIVTTALVAVQFPTQEHTVPSLEEVSDVEIEDIGTGDPDEEVPYDYLLRVHDGRIGVFAAGQEEPQMVLDVLIKYLPDFDRQQLEEGIPVADLNQLSALIEDYTS